jgi:hypothetical protein
MKFRFALLSILAIAGASFVPTLASALEAGVIIVDRAPPAPRTEPPPPPREGFVWSPGYWKWDGYNYSWQEGNWIQTQQPTAKWVPDHWVERNGRWEFVPGHWSS